MSANDSILDRLRQVRAKLRPYYISDDCRADVEAAYLELELIIAEMS